MRHIFATRSQFPVKRSRETHWQTRQSATRSVTSLSLAPSEDFAIGGWPSGIAWVDVDAICVLDEASHESHAGADQVWGGAHGVLRAVGGFGRDDAES
jgi:hypothetical protein